MASDEPSIIRSKPRTNFSQAFQFDQNLIEFERSVIRREAVGYAENVAGEVFVSNLANSEHPEYPQSYFVQPSANDKTGEQVFTTTSQYASYFNNNKNRSNEHVPSIPQASSSYNNLEVNFSDVFDTRKSYDGKETDGHHEHQEQESQEEEEEDSKIDPPPSNIPHHPPSVLDNEFEDERRRRSQVSNTPINGQLGHGGSSRSGDGSEKLLENLPPPHRSSQVGKKTKLSILSQDGNVLNSPASRHLISQFEKFLVKEFIIKRSPSVPPPALPPQADNNAIRMQSAVPMEARRISTDHTSPPQTYNKSPIAHQHHTSLDVSLSEELNHQPDLVQDYHFQHESALRHDLQNKNSASSRTQESPSSDNGTIASPDPEVAPDDHHKSSHGIIHSDPRANTTTEHKSIMTSDPPLPPSSERINDAWREGGSGESGVKSSRIKIIPESIVTQSLLTVTKYQVVGEETNNPIAMDPANDDDTLNERKARPLERPRLVSAGKVPCRYAFSGCKEMLERGSMYEQDHYQSCKYRPVECLLGPACKETLAYHNYIPHLMQHFLVPTYSTQMVTTVILTPEDFTRNQTWTPKWFCAHQQHFFAMLRRNTDQGIWTSWAWMLGTPEEADNFAVRITLFKGLKEVSQVFPVHSIRIKLEEIEEQRTCLFLNDQTINELTRIGSNMFADFSLKVQLISNAKQLNNTTRELRIMSRSKPKPLRSEKLYVTTLNAIPESDDEEDDL